MSRDFYCTEQDRIDADRSWSRDSSRLGTGCVFAVRGRCASCPRKLYGSVEAEAGICTDCQIAAERAA